MQKWQSTSGLFNPSSARWLMASLVLVISHTAQATDPSPSLSFSYKDWDLICDNSLTCRAAGYSSDDTDPAATVLLTRQAGPGTAITNSVMLADYDGTTDAKKPGKPELLIDGRSQGALLPADGDSWQMNATQYPAFMQALRKDSKISFKDRVNEYVFSGAGSSAVLLKMDDVQGRIGTIGALFKKGNKDESLVKPPLPLPVIIKAPVIDKQSRDMTPQEAALIKPVLQKIIAGLEDPCSDEQQQEPWKIAALNQTQSLVTLSCWMAAYNSGDLAFVINNKMDTAPIKAADSITSYEDGELSFSMKGRGLGDCWSFTQWVWDGKSFVESENGDTGRCRLIRPGGAWELPLIKSKVTSGQP